MLGAMAEEKMMLMLAALCVLMAVLINQFIEKDITIRKLVIFFGLILGGIIAINAVNRLAPDMLSILFNKKKFYGLCNSNL